MAVQKQEFKVLSANGVHKLASVVFLPTTQPVGFFQVVHGMTEYIGRYEKFMTEMVMSYLIRKQHLKRMDMIILQILYTKKILIENS